MTINLSNILTSGFNFNENESLQEYRFKFLNSLFIVSIVFVSIATAVRLYLQDYTIVFIDLFMNFSFISFMLLLRRDKKFFNPISTLQLSIVFIAFTAIVIILPEDQSKLLWYALLISATFMAKGYKGGLAMYGAIVITILALFLLPNIDIHLRPHELVMTLLVYTAIAIYSTLLDIQQQKDLNNIRKTNQKIKEHQKQLYHQLRTHPGSNLPNQLALEETLNTCDDNIALLSLKIDDFISLSDVFGSEVLQQLTIETAKILKQYDQPSITLFHIQDDHFSFLLKEPAPKQDIKLAQSIKSLFENIHIPVETLEISISFSIGIARGNREKIIVQAQTILHEIMQEGANTYKLFHFDPKKEEEKKNNIYWNRKIKETIKEGNLRVYYQPIISNKDGKIVKYEALIRAYDQNRVIPPYFFLQAAKSRGMLPALTKTVIDHSFKAFQKSNLEFSINITEADLIDDYLVTFLCHKIQTYNIDPKRVYLEVLENITSIKSENVTKQFSALKALGFQIAIDDFGAEASNLSRLLTLDADIIKIDGQFIKNIDTDTNSVKIVETIVSLAHKIGAETIAEFVHNETVFHIVKSLGVDYSQGYHFSPPLPAPLSQTHYDLVSV